MKQNELKYEIAADNEPMFLEAKKKLEEQLQSEEYKKSSRLFNFVQFFPKKAVKKEYFGLCLKRSFRLKFIFIYY